MARYFINLSFDGKRYHGWQIQPNGISVQGELQRCLSMILRTEISVVGADEKMYLDAGMIYPLERFIHEKEDAPENTDNASEDSGNTEGSEEDSKDVEEDKEAGEA